MPSKIIFITVLMSGFLNAQMKVSTGSLKHFENFPSKYVEARNVDIWFPDNYSDKNKYAVLYMHDGQMLFDANTTWNNQEWRADEVAGKLITDKKTNKFIIVGISSIATIRHSDYFPQRAFESLTAKQQDSLYSINRSDSIALFGTKVNSDNYLKFIVKELKPFIDNTLSVYSDRQHTFIAGSSMGGLISMYAICEYPDVFGGAACLSTHWPGVFQTQNNPIPKAFLNYLDHNLPSPKNHKMYFDYGTATLDAAYKPFQMQADEIMKSKGYDEKSWISQEFVGADHSEKSWAERLDIPLLFLLGR